MRVLAQLCIDARHNFFAALTCCVECVDGSAHTHACRSRPFLMVEVQLSGWTAHSDEPVDTASRLRVVEVERSAEIVARYGARQCVHLDGDGCADCDERIAGARDRPGVLLCARHAGAATMKSESLRASDERKILRSRARALEALSRVIPPQRGSAQTLPAVQISRPPASSAAGACGVIEVCQPAPFLATLDPEGRAAVLAERKRVHDYALENGLTTEPQADS